MSGKGKDTNRGAPVRKKMTDGERRVRQYVYGNLSRVDQVFHLKLMHVLGGVSLLSLLAAFEVFSIPASSGIIDILKLGSTMATPPLNAATLSQTVPATVLPSFRISIIPPDAGMENTSNVCVFTFAGHT